MLIADRIHWQYGSGSHANDSRQMIGSVMISARPNDGTEVNIRHTVIGRSSQRLIGRKGTFKCNTIHTNGNYQKPSNQKIIPLQNTDMYSYVPSYIFLNPTNHNRSNFHANLFCGTASIDESTNVRLWSELKKIID